MSNKLLDFLSQNGNKSGAIIPSPEALKKLKESIDGVPLPFGIPGMSQLNDIGGLLQGLMGMANQFGIGSVGNLGKIIGQVQGAIGGGSQGLGQIMSTVSSLVGSSGSGGGSPSSRGDLPASSLGNLTSDQLISASGDVISLFAGLSRFADVTPDEPDIDDHALIFPPNYGGIGSNSSSVAYANVEPWNQTLKWGESSSNEQQFYFQGRDIDASVTYKYPANNGYNYISGNAGQELTDTPMKYYYEIEVYATGNVQVGVMTHLSDRTMTDHGGTAARTFVSSALFTGNVKVGVCVDMGQKKFWASTSEKIDTSILPSTSFAAAQDSPFWYPVIRFDTVNDIVSLSDKFKLSPPLGYIPWCGNQGQAHV